MPTVLRVDGFVVKIFLPPREHGPPHVHVLKADGEVIIEFGWHGENCFLREAHGMNSRDIVEAFRIVGANADALLGRWKEYHGR